MNRAPYFSVVYRNPGHWDINGREERAFRIRGEAGRVVIHDERTDTARPFPREPRLFRSVQAAMAWIADEMMIEPLS